MHYHRLDMMNSDSTFIYFIKFSFGAYRMGDSLFEQLKKSGLVDEKKARKAKQSQYKGKQPKAKKGAALPVDETKLLAQKVHLDKVAHDRMLNQQKKNRDEIKAIAAQIRQLIENSRIIDREGNVTFNFTDAKVIKQIFITDKIQRQLTSGFLAIVKLGQSYELVPVSVANKIKQRDAEYIVFCNDGSDTPVDEEDDPYADYHIPDDLMW
jgi:hypothetical protein